ncbi:hypothetical protein PISL3812_04323 [Talaromyces islandicus]|uniref:O-methyltransferase C-terminal domain-containing protein n=1 Tax=Talaromyces islandicus TaxID=28573 RepID=A0A0U1LX01_TALIS|nr:hypothetical protein PISL3812_04323 [Talaromyces islandicus]
MSATSTSKKNDSPSIGPYFRYMAEIGVIKVFVDHQIFALIPTSNEDGISLFEISTTIHADYNLLERLSNFLVAAEILSAPRPGYIAHTATSLQFVDPGSLQVLFFNHVYDFFLVPTVSWPEYMKQHGLVEPKSASQTPFGLSAGYPDKTVYEILEKMPEPAARFNQAMAASLPLMPVLGVYDFAWIGEYCRAHSGGSDEAGRRPLIVDVGGGKGQALKEILTEYPSIAPEQCVLQDRPEVIVEAQEQQNSDDWDILRPVKKIASSFFLEQPTKGALVYHIRRVLNDWPDDDAVLILRQIRSVAAPDSRVLISEQILRDPPTLRVAALDLFMMNFGGKRRSERLFREIAERAGWRVSRILRDGDLDSGVVELLVNPEYTLDTPA